MSSLELKLRNDLKGENVKVKEGNAGIFRHLATLNQGQTYTLRHDPNATYREFMLITLPNMKELPLLSTDLFHKYKEIIVFKAHDTYDWTGMPRHDPPAPAAGEAPQDNRRGKVAAALRRFFSKS